MASQLIELSLTPSRSSIAEVYENEKEMAKLLGQVRVRQDELRALQRDIELSRYYASKERPTGSRVILKGLLGISVGVAIVVVAVQINLDLASPLPLFAIIAAAVAIGLGLYSVIVSEKRHSGSRVLSSVRQLLRLNRAEGLFSEARTPDSTRRSTYPPDRIEWEIEEATSLAHALEDSLGLASPRQVDR